MTPSPEASPVPAALEAEIHSIYLLYEALLRESGARPGAQGPETGAGGCLLYAGDLDAEGCRLVRAANVAGAASLAASADASAARQAMREGVVDFVVNSLDEALRILKNQIRKRETAAVGVTLAPELVTQQMLERGVLPDLLAPSNVSRPGAALSAFLAQGARRIQPTVLPSDKKHLVLPVPSKWAQDTAKFDAWLLGFVASTDHLNRRWLRLAPRYLGPQARRFRSLVCGREQGIGSRE